MLTILKNIVVGLQLLLLFGGSWISGFNEVHKFTQFSPKENDRVDDVVHYRRSHSRENTRTAYDVIKALGATEFLRLATVVKLDSLLKNPNSNTTFFVPTNEAMQVVTPNLCSNMTSMNMIIRFHMVSGLIKLSDIVENGMLSTLAKYGQDTAKFHLKIRTNIYKMDNSQLTSASGAEIIKPNQNGNGTIVHLVNKALFPLPIESAYYTILHHPDFSILKTFLERSFTLLRVLSDLDRSLTFFAPTDDAFKKLPTDVFRKLQDDVVLFTTVLVEHIASNISYSVGIPVQSTIKGVAGNNILLKKMQNNFIVTTNKVSGHLSISDISVMNGVIHGIDTVLYNPSPKSSIDIIG